MRRTRSVARLCLQHLNADPSCPPVIEVTSNDTVQLANILQTSNRASVYIDTVEGAIVEALLPSLSGGRFLLGVVCSPEGTDSVASDAIA
jgi:hypothetical protein